MLTIYPKFQTGYTVNRNRARPGLQENNSVNPSSLGLIRGLVSPYHLIAFSGFTPDPNPPLPPDNLASAIITYCKKPGITADDMVERVRLAVSSEEGRYEHCLRVTQKAVELAGEYGVDPKKAALAGLLHDLAKGVRNDDLIQYTRDHNLPVIDYEMDSPKKLHAPVGAHMVSKEFGIDDEQILRAIRTHAIGSEDPQKKRLSPLDKILIIADNSDSCKINGKGKKRKILEKFAQASESAQGLRPDDRLNRIVIEYFIYQIEKALINSKPIELPYVKNYNALVLAIKSQDPAPETSAS